MDEMTIDENAVGKTLKNYIESVDGIWNDETKEMLKNGYYEDDTKHYDIKHYEIDYSKTELLEEAIITKNVEITDSLRVIVEKAFGIR